LKFFLQFKYDCLLVLCISILFLVTFIWLKFISSWYRILCKIITRQISIVYLFFSIDTLRSRSNNSNSISYVFFAQITLLNIDKNTFIFSSISDRTLKIDSRNKDSCRNNKVEILILLKIAEFDYTKNYYNAANQNSQNTKILQEEFRLSDKKYQHIITAVDSRDKEDSILYTQQYIQKLKKKQLFYKNLNIFSKIRLQVFQKLFETESDVSIFSYNIEKQTICKKKKTRLDNLSFSSTKNISTKANVLRIIDSYYSLVQTRILSAIYSQNSIQIIQSKLATQIVSEDFYTNLSISEKSIAVFNRIEKRLLQVDKTI